ncbi:MAG: hypothetical protein V4548_00020 [Bacteroidota bacterium]
MKIKAILLVSYLSLLILSQALCSLCTAMKEGKASAKIEQTTTYSDSSHTNKLHNNMSCCSFQNCQCVFEIVKPLNILFYPLNENKKTINTSHQLRSNYSFSFWHPPKLG